MYVSYANASVLMSVVNIQSLCINMCCCLVFNAIIYPTFHSKFWDMLIDLGIGIMWGLTCFLETCEINNVKLSQQNTVKVSFYGVFDVMVRWFFCTFMVFCYVVSVLFFLSYMHHENNLVSCEPDLILIMVLQTLWKQTYLTRIRLCINNQRVIRTSKV